MDIAKITGAEQSHRGRQLTAVFVFTALTTALSSVGWLEFRHEGQQEKLFYLFIVEVVTVVEIEGVRYFL